MEETNEDHPYGRCEACGGPIQMIIRRNTRFCSGQCEESAKS